MPGYVIRNPAIKIANVDLSDHVREVNVNMSAPEVDVTASGGGRSRLQGIRDDNFALTAYSDFAAASLDATLWPLFSGSSQFLVEVWANGTTTSSTNPKYSGTCILTEYNPISGAIGDAAITPVTLPVQNYITRATS